MGDLHYLESSLGPASGFLTPTLEWALWDDFVVEFQPFKFSITFKEAKNTVFKKILGFKQALLQSILPVLGGIPTNRFKLQEQINLDNLASVEYFELEKKVNPTRRDMILWVFVACNRPKTTLVHQMMSAGWWLKIGEYALEQEEILQWLDKVWNGLISVSTCSKLNVEENSCSECNL